MTPTNRYGISLALALATAPLISLLLFGSMRRFRAIAASTLGEFMAMNALTQDHEVKALHCDALMNQLNPRRHGPDQTYSVARSALYCISELTIHQ